jgi:hypothetical protein
MDFTGAPTPAYIGPAAPGIFWPLVSPSKVAGGLREFRADDPDPGAGLEHNSSLFLLRRVDE